MSPEHQEESLADLDATCPDLPSFKRWLGHKNDGEGEWINIVRLAVWAWNRKKNPRPATKRMRQQPDPSHDLQSPLPTGSGTTSAGAHEIRSLAPRTMSAAAEWGMKRHLASDDIRFLEKIGFSQESDVALITEEDWGQVPVLTRRRIENAISQK